VRRFLPLIGWLAAAPAVLAGGVEFEARLWSPDLSGVAQVGNHTGNTAIDLASDLGFDHDETLDGRLIWRPTRRTSVRLSYLLLDFAGDAQLNRAISFAGTTFQLEAQVASLIELEYGGVGMAWQPVSTSDGRFRLGPLVEARGIRGEAAISTDILGILPLSAAEEFELAFVAAGLALDAEASEKLHVYAEWTTTVESDDGELTGAEAGLRVYPVEVLALTLGYRRLEIDAAGDTEQINLELDGPFFGAVLRF
jgi:hypothetical protein